METPFSKTDRDLTPHEVAERVQEGQLDIIDVRQQDEWEAGHPQGAWHIPLEQLAERASEIAPNQPIAFMCLGGFRSALATEAFRAKGYEAYNLTGGFRAWLAADLPSDPDDAVAKPHGRPPSAT